MRQPVCGMLLCCFFFFKQKTAYEMRISDWSSDVCSSDLQFANGDNPRAHIETTGPELWDQTDGQITHFVSAMGTTGTIMGVGSYLHSRNKAIQIVGAQPAEGSQIPGIRKWPEAYQPSIYRPNEVDCFELISQTEADDMARRLASEKGNFGGISWAGALVAAMRVAARVENATIAFIDRTSTRLNSS